MRSAQGSRRCREEGPLTWVLYKTQIKQGVSAGSIGQASKESRPEALAEQAWSLDQIHRLSNEQVKTGWDYGQANGRCVPYHFWTNETEQELGFGSFLFRIFSSYQVKIQQYVGTRMQ
jgi:hypothetical protein